ncbi:MAG: phage tail protein [Acidimicrobiales bacterium]
MTDAIARPAAQPGNRVDPYRAYTFKLRFNNLDAGHFTEVGGLGVRVERITYREAGNAAVRAIPGQVSYSPVTLRYGLTDSTSLWDWLLEAVAGRVTRRAVTIAMLDSTGNTEVFWWNLRDAWPAEWHGAPLDALCRELAIESLVLAHEGIERDGSGAPAGAPA